MLHNRRKRVLEHILNEGGITRAYALATFHVQNLPQVIMELRNMGWPIRNSYYTREDGVRTVQYYIAEHTRWYAQYLGRVIIAGGRYVAVLADQAV